MSQHSTARPILRYGDPLLHRPCAQVTDLHGIDELLTAMFASMYAAGGVGLAANQIGIPLRVFVLNCPDTNGTHLVGHVLNPVLTLPYPPPDPILAGEGCLSVPGPYAELARPATATVTGIDHTGVPLTLTGTGFLARCLQHEIDHLNGIVYLDRLDHQQRADILIQAGLAG